MCDTQPPNCALFAVHGADDTAQKQGTDHKAKASVDMQRCEE